MTTAEAIETSVTTTNSLSQDSSDIDDNISQTSIVYVGKSTKQKIKLIKTS